MFQATSRPVATGVVAMAVDLGVRKLTSDRNEVVNDTGRTAYCGPYVVSAITGFPVSRIEDEINRGRQVVEGAKPLVRGTYPEEVRDALRAHGYVMKMTACYMDLPRKQRPSVWSWMQLPRNMWAHYILAIHKGKEGHWILIKGVKLCDTYSDGKWQFVCDGPHKGAKIMEIYEVRRALDV